MSPLVLPAHLVDHPFAVSEGLSAGLTLRDLRSRTLVLPTRGVRVLDEPESVVDRARAFAEILPGDAAYSHVTALELHGLPLPSGARQLELDVMRESNRIRIRRAGCRGHRGLEIRGVECVDTLRVVNAADTWCDLGELGPARADVADLVAVGDAIANRHDPAVLRASLEKRVRPRGRVVLEEALDLIRVGSRSAMETRTRLMFVEAGFPEPRINAGVLDADGGWLLTGDLVWDEERVVVEYQGATHADRSARSHDADRASVASDEGARVFEVFAEDVFDGRRRRRLLHRVALALHLDPGRLTIG